jgi:hypothetical protein
VAHIWRDLRDQLMWLDPDHQFSRSPKVQKTFDRVANSMKRTLNVMNEPGVIDIFKDLRIRIGHDAASTWNVEQLVAAMTFMTSVASSKVDHNARFELVTRSNGRGSPREQAVWNVLAPAYERMFGCDATFSRTAEPGTLKGEFVVFVERQFARRGIGLTHSTIDCGKRRVAQAGRSRSGQLSN